MLAVLRQRNFALLWTGQALSAIGDWILWIGLPFYIYTRTGSTLATGAMFIATTLPGLLVGSFAGVLVDQWDRRHVMLVADLARTAITLFLLIALKPGALWLIYPLALLNAAIAQFFNPAKSALLPTLVKSEQLLNANALNSLSSDLAMLLGPPLGGLLIGLLGFRGSILLDAGSFLISACCIFCCSPSHLPRPSGNGIRHTYREVWQQLRQDWVAGLQRIQHERVIGLIFIVMGIAMFGQGIIFVLWAVFVQQVLQGGPWEYGWVQVAVAVGGLFGASILGRLAIKRIPTWLIGSSGMLIGLLLFATYNLPSLRLILVLQFMNGLAAVGFFVPSETLLQQAVSDTYRGRVFGTYQTTNALLLLMGQGLASILGDRIGLVPMLNSSAILYFLSGTMALLLLARQP